MTMIEVLTVMAIGVVLTGMMILIWAALRDSYSVTAMSSESRDLARDAVARMSREIRDMEPLEGQDAALLAQPYKIQFTTTFNAAGNESASRAPILTEYEYVKAERSLHRRRDTNGDGVIGAGDSDTVVIRYLLNTYDEVAQPDVPVFRYTYVNGASLRVTTDSATESDLRRIMLVNVRLLVDLNPGRTPKPMDLTTTVQLRNQRHF
jgi:hypothetical protein